MTTCWKASFSSPRPSWYTSVPELEVLPDYTLVGHTTLPFNDLSKSVAADIQTGLISCATQNKAIKGVRVVSSSDDILSSKYW